jgi:hypothetical protein
VRRLRVLYSLSRGGVPVLVMASLVPAFDACSNDDLPDAPPGSRGDASATDGAGGSDGTDARVGSGGLGGIIIQPPPPFDVGTVDRNCADGAPSDSGYPFPPATRPMARCCSTFVDLPPEGTPALIEAICIDVGDSATTSGWGARVTLSGSPRFSTAGTIEIAPALANRVVGRPTVALLEADPPAWGDIVLTGVRDRAFGGFEFDVSWPKVPPFRDGVRITMEVTFVVRCNEEGGPPSDGPETTRTVKALTNLVLCGSSVNASSWLPSGEICNVCAIIAEMAPTPIVPARHEDPLPLGEALRLNVKTIARVGRSFVLLAEHDGGSSGHTYAWKASAGELVRVADDIVTWTPPEGAMLELVQVAVESARAAGVASLRWDRAA